MAGTSPTMTADASAAMFINKQKDRPEGPVFAFQGKSRPREKFS
ncbi:hypothetical protein SAMN05444169_0392 [Bradyrhizobium erythrophlei]|uniref:Uncharacterized protein n=1 Tax=Bradyrhizobium erythrophlei TaxID=1437360 RepID=A0A1M5GUT3_9BRAD|nr:hypothetical protein SAMN05444169_0392 [Bradyrhizobium erythrophlei]